MRFLLPGETRNESVNQLRTQTEDLIEFLSFLNMGEYYSNKLRSLIGWVPPMKIKYHSSTESLLHLRDDLQREEEYSSKYVNKVYMNADTTIELVIECLRFQDWKAKNPYAE